MIKVLNYGIQRLVCIKHSNSNYSLSFLKLGQVKSKFPMRKIPYCISFNPNESKQHLFICGMSDKKILCVRRCLV